MENERSRVVGIDERKRAEALLAGENRILELVASGRPLPVVLDSLCRLFDALAEGCSSSVLVLDRARKRVQQVEDGWSTPILSSIGKPLGTFTVYPRNGGSPAPYQAFIQRLARIAGIAIERAQTDAELKQSEAF